MKKVVLCNKLHHATESMHNHQQFNPSGGTASIVTPRRVFRLLIDTSIPRVNARRAEGGEQTGKADLCLPRGAGRAVGSLPGKALLSSFFRLLQPKQPCVQVEGQGWLPFTRLVVRSFNVPDCQPLGFWYISLRLLLICLRTSWAPSTLTSVMSNVGALVVRTSSSFHFFPKKANIFPELSFLPSKYFISCKMLY